MSRVVAVLVFAVLTLGAAAGCGSGLPSVPSVPTSMSGSPEPVSTVPPGTACEVLTLEAVSAFMGQPAHVDKGNANECDWLTQTNGIYQLQLQVFDDHNYYAPEQWGTPEPIPALGQEAFLVRKSVVGTVAGFWDGKHAVFLAYAKLVGTAPPEDKADELVVLLRLAASHLK
jgi:hypothetical protein